MRYQLVAVTKAPEETFVWNFEEEIVATTTFTMWLGWMNIYLNDFRLFEDEASGAMALKPSAIGVLKLIVTADPL